MKTKKLAIASAIGAVAVVALMFAYPAMAASAQAQQNDGLRQFLRNPQSENLPRVHLTDGQTINITSVAGGYHQVGDMSINGSASGSLTLTVSGGFTGGYALTVTGGSLNINGTTYAITGGSAELGPYGVHMVGQAQTISSGQFLFGVRDLGKFGSTDYGILKVDLSNGSAEFVARLLVTISA